MVHKFRKGVKMQQARSKPILLRNYNEVKPMKF